ncbi:MAG: TIGR01777 family oxidoreductase [Gemmataceae bacterium]
MRIFVTGGTGLVGTRLLKKLTERGDEVVLLTRRPEAAKGGDRIKIVGGDPTEAGPWMDEAAACDAAINLVGENIFAKRWSDDFKATLRKSRIPPTQHVVDALARNSKRADGSPKVLVSASAIGFYGPHGDEELDESTPPANDFMGQLCVEWEQAALAGQQKGLRVAVIRTGIVLDPAGGALKEMMPPFKMFVGGPIGSGKQVMSWIHAEDQVGIILHALDHAEVSGPVNSTAPNPVTNKAFSKALGKAIGRPSFMWTPGFAIRLVLGGVADVVVNGQRVMPKKAAATGYQFKYPEIDGALANLLAK